MPPVATLSPVKEARIRALLTLRALERLAGVSYFTLRRAEMGIRVSPLTQEKITRALATALGEDLRREELFGGVAA